MSLKEKAIASILGVIVLYAGAVGTWFFVSEAAWAKASRTFQRERDRYVKEERLIGEKQKWKDAYETEKAAMPMFKQGQATDTTWLRKVEDIAKKNLVVISRIEHGDEVEADDVYELQIKVQRFEASLEALVKFIHEIENTDDGMFDIKSLNNVKPGAKKGYLTGSFVLTCAYMREK